MNRISILEFVHISRTRSLMGYSSASVRFGEEIYYIIDFDSTPDLSNAWYNFTNHCAPTYSTAECVETTSVDASFVLNLTYIESSCKNNILTIVRGVCCDTVRQSAVVRKI